MRKFRGCFQTMLKEHTTEEQRYVVGFLWTKNYIQRIFIQKRYLFTVASVCRVKRFTTGSKNSLKDVRKTDYVRPGRPVEIATETTVQRVKCWLLYCGLRRTCKATGQAYQCWWRICREINVIQGWNITYFTSYIHFWPIYWFSVVVRGILNALI
jgi:hypothetical protein